MSCSFSNLLRWFAFPQWFSVRHDLISFRKSLLFRSLLKPFIYPFNALFDQTRSFWGYRPHLLIKGRESSLDSLGICVERYIPFGCLRLYLIPIIYITSEIQIWFLWICCRIGFCVTFCLNWTGFWSWLYSGNIHLPALGIITCTAAFSTKTSALCRIVWGGWFKLSNHQTL